MILPNLVIDIAPIKNIKIQLVKVNEYPFVPLLCRPNLHRYTRIARLGYVLPKRQKIYGTIRNIYVTLT